MDTNEIEKQFKINGNRERERIEMNLKETKRNLRSKGKVNVF